MKDASITEGWVWVFFDKYSGALELPLRERKDTWIIVNMQLCTLCWYGTVVKSESYTFALYERYLGNRGSENEWFFVNTPVYCDSLSENIRWQSKVGVERAYPEQRCVFFVIANIKKDTSTTEGLWLFQVDFVITKTLLKQFWFGN